MDVTDLMMFLEVFIQISFTCTVQDVSETNSIAQWACKSLIVHVVEESGLRIR